jgi:hypothetical protein
LSLPTRLRRRTKEAVERELRKPYDEKQLALYLDAARVLAHLAAAPENEHEKTEARLWELYWGELAFVESKHIEKLMVLFCEKHFTGSNKCHTQGSKDLDHPPTPEAAAINMSHEANKEIRKRWEEGLSIWPRFLRWW